jgi:MoaA/NifB/PqqE/SkfB family radical SAM enzyme
MPLIRGLVLTNRCKLHCRHCDVATRGPNDLGFGEVKAAVDAFYREGGRCLSLEGGEPFLWQEGPHRLVSKLWGASRRDLWPERAILS